MRIPRLRMRVSLEPVPKKIKFSDMSENIIRISDIVLEILDARFIDETRNKKSEELIKKLGKKIIFVINKSDLVDVNAVKANLPEDMRPYIFISCKSRKGASMLRNRIKREIHELVSDKFQRKHVGVIGYPNTGKSSIINMMIGRSSAKTSPEAGFTRGIQRVKLAKNLLLIDTPGVIPDKEFNFERIMETGKHSKIGVRTYNQVKDPYSESYSLFKKYPEQIKKFYDITAEDFNDFIEQLGIKCKFLLKGNVVDEDRTCRKILRDWQEGKIKV